ncbi:hypothetical protein ACFYXM_03485 [Streptomyces sp. NPDC002476]
MESAIAADAACERRAVAVRPADLRDHRLRALRASRATAQASGRGRRTRQ